MGCRYNDFNGKCQMFEGDIEDDLGCDEDGICICEDAENPEELCSNYESDDEMDDEIDDESELDED